MIKLSEVPEYIEYGSAIAARDYNRAKVNLLKCISIATASAENETVALLLQFLGDAEYDSGNKKAAIMQYEKAESVSPDSPLTRLMFAKFLAVRYADSAGAEKKCDETEEILKTKWKPSDDDLSEEEYKRRLNEIRNITEQPKRGNGN